jgi:hypothetical protein
MADTDMNPIVNAVVPATNAVTGAPDQASHPIPIGQGPSTASAPAIASGSKATDKFGPRKRGNQAPRKDSSTRVGLASILKITGRMPLYNLDNYVPNIYVPSFVAMFYVLHLMDRTMAMTHRFLQGAPLWNSFASQAYIGLLTIVHIFRIERAAGHFVAAHDAFLSVFLNFRSLDTLVIPGPLVPFFEALGTSSPFSDQLDDVFASLGNNTTAHGNRAFQADNIVIERIPNPLFALDQYFRILESVNTASNANDARPVIDVNNFIGYQPDNAFRAVAGIQLNDNVMRTPQMRWPVPITAGVVRSNRENAPLFPFSTQGNVTTGPAVGGVIPSVPTRRYRLASFANNNVLDWAQFLGLTPIGTRPTTPWLGPVSAMMQRYCEFFKDSTTLAQIPVTSVGANQVICTYSPGSNVPAPAATAVLGTYTTPTNLELAVRHVHPTMIAVPLPVQIAAITQTHARGLSSDINTESGPLWNVTPDVQQSSYFDLSVSMDAHVAAHYHVDSRLT